MVHLASRVETYIDTIPTPSNRLRSLCRFPVSLPPRIYLPRASLDDHHPFGGEINDSGFKQLLASSGGNATENAEMAALLSSVR